MRRFRMAMGAFAAAMTAACARHEVAASAVDGVLVLEVGGDQSSLRQALVAAGVEVAPPQPRTPRNDDSEPAREPADSGESGEAPAPGVPPEAPVSGTSADHVVVELGRGETLMQIAKKHLGSSSRYHEILERNGWTEADARRLRAGQLVKVPIDRATTNR